MSFTSRFSERVRLSSRKIRGVPPRRRRSVLLLEHLEHRIVPSTITWANEYDPTNNFSTVFGGRAALATRVVEAAVDSWSHVITDFHTSTKTFSVNISMLPNNTGQGAQTLVNSSGHGTPTSATITIDSGADGHGSYLFLDPTVPADPNQFNPVDSFYRGTNQNAFASEATNDTGLSSGFADSEAVCERPSE